MVKGAKLEGMCQVWFRAKIEVNNSRLDYCRLECNGKKENCPYASKLKTPGEDFVEGRVLVKGFY